MVSVTTTIFSVLPLLLLSSLTGSSNLGLGLGLVGATPVIHTRQLLQQRDSSASSGTVSVTFIGAADAQYTLDIPLNSVFTPTNNALSISHIVTPPSSTSSEGSGSGSGGPCVFFGVDGAVYVSPPAGGEGDVGPPQTIAGGICGPFPGHEYGMW